jgi:hypothetical protein
MDKYRIMNNVVFWDVVLYTASNLTNIAQFYNEGYGPKKGYLANDEDDLELLSFRSVPVFYPERT